MPVIENGKLTQTSVSQVQTFDTCPRKWWFEYKHHQRPDQGAAAAAGDAGHQLLATVCMGKPLPTRAPMLKVVSAVVLKGELPKPGPDLFVELRGDGQPKYSERTCECGHPLIQHAAPEKKKRKLLIVDVSEDGDETPPAPRASCAECSCSEPKPAWLPLLRAKTLSIAGVPFELFIDLTWRRGEIPDVLDHKFKALELMAPRDVMPGGTLLEHELIETVQMPVYALAMMRQWPDAKQWRLTHHYIARTASGGSFMRSQLVSRDQILEREGAVAASVERMKVVSGVTEQRDVPFNRHACSDHGGCPHQSICHAFKENQVQLTAAEEAEFAKLDGITLDDAPPQTQEKSPPPADEDEEAKAEREFKARMAKIKADKEAKAKAEADAKAKAEAEAKAKAAEAAKDPASTQSVLPGDAPGSKPELASEKPAEKGAKGKGTKVPPASGVSVTLHFASAAEAAAYLAGK